MKLIIFLLSLINFNYCLAVSNDSPNLDYNDENDFLGSLA